MIEAVARPTRPFLLMEGGALYRIESRVGLIRERVPILKRRAGLAVLLTWGVLFILALIQGTAYGRKVPVPFLRDFTVYTRFLLAAPLLLVAESIIGPRIAGAAEEFVKSGVVIEKDYQKFDAAVERALKSRDSIQAEVILIILAYIGTFISFKEAGVEVSTWDAFRSDAGTSVTFAGWWLHLFCVPLLQFLQLRWFWRLFLWFRFLAQVRSLDIQLFPTHPDHAGGLGFVGDAQRFFGILLFTTSILLTGVFANNIVYDKTPLEHFAPMIALYVVLALIVILGPLVLFTGKLLKIKRAGLYQYGALATAYTGAFQRKWIKGDNPGEPLLGTGDIQSLADLANSFAVIEHMDPMPVNPRTILHLTAACLLPMATLLLTIMSPKEVLKLVLKVLA
jgi:hypothetical protein